MRICLNGNDWFFSCFYADCGTFNMESGVDFRIGHLFENLPATVPGGVQLDLLNNGLIGDPFVGHNALLNEWAQHKNWKYVKKFTLPKEVLGRKARIEFAGVNFEANFYLNGRKLGNHKNIHTPAVFDVTNDLKEENELTVLLENIPEDETQIGRGTKCKYQDQRFAYAWDFCAQMVAVGIFRGVELVVSEKYEITDLFAQTDFVAGKWVLNLDLSTGSFDGVPTEITLEKDGKTVYNEKVTVCKNGNFVIEVENPELWYPNTYGEQALYTLKVRLFDGVAVADERTLSVGFRSLAYEKNEGAPEDSLPYTIVVNGKKIYSKGTIFLPFDQLLGRIDKGGYDEWFKMIKRANVNLIRLWGGGVFETNYFYQLCDKYGVMVWQDFMQSSSGLEGIPSVEPEFLEELTKSSVHIIKTVRNHVSTVTYCGGNELTSNTNLARKVPVDYDHKNVALLKSLVEAYDPRKQFIPTTPCGPNFDNQLDDESILNKTNHNVHGPWYYMGTTQHYSDNNRSRCQYHGEVGSDGMISYSSMKKFLNPETVKRTDLAWRIHGAWWWETIKRDVEAFGEKANDIRLDIHGSQLLQAEGLRYIIARSRGRAFCCSGSNIWQFNEPWPNVCCSSLVDYYRVPKMAYYALKKAYAPVFANLKYDSVCVPKGSELKAELHLSNLGNETYVEPVRVEIISGDEIVDACVYESGVAVNTDKKLADISFTPNIDGVFFIRLTYGNTVENYCFGTSETHVFAPLMEEKEVNLALSYQDGELTVKNVGENAAYFVSLEEIEHTGEFLIEDNYLCLLSGESRVLKCEGYREGNLKIENFTKGGSES